MGVQANLILPFDISTRRTLLGIAAEPVVAFAGASILAGGVLFLLEPDAAGVLRFVSVARGLRAVLPGDLLLTGAEKSVSSPLRIAVTVNSSSSLDLRGLKVCEVTLIGCEVTLIHFELEIGRA